MIGLASSQGGLVDHVRYSPYGVPTRLNPADVADDAGNPLSSSSGVNNGLNEGDYNFFFNEYFNNNPALDIGSAAGEIFPGGDGVVDSGDYNLFFNEFFVSYARGQLTADGVANRLGYAGYEFDPVLIGSGSGAAASDPTCFYHVRHRVYDSQNGRWTRRDPLGYVDGMGLYEYCRSKSIRYFDGFGLASQPVLIPYGSPRHLYPDQDFKQSPTQLAKCYDWCDQKYPSKSGDYNNANCKASCHSLMPGRESMNCYDMCTMLCKNADGTVNEKCRVLCLEPCSLGRKWDSDCNARLDSCLTANDAAAFRCLDSNSTARKIITTGGGVVVGLCTAKLHWGVGLVVGGACSWELDSIADDIWGRCEQRRLNGEAHCKHMYRVCTGWDGPDSYPVYPYPSLNPKDPTDRTDPNRLPLF